MVENARLMQRKRAQKLQFIKRKLVAAHAREFAFNGAPAAHGIHERAVAIENNTQALGRSNRRIIRHNGAGLPYLTTLMTEGSSS